MVKNYLAYEGMTTEVRAVAQLNALIPIDCTPLMKENNLSASMMLHTG